MATYYSSLNHQRDAAPMLYLRETLPGSYSEAPALPGNMMYVNYPSSSGSYSDTLAGNSQQQNSGVEIPSLGVMDANQATLPQQEILSNLGGSRIVEHDYNAWRDGRNEMLIMHPMDGPSGILHQNLQVQGLSLSLGTQIPSGIQMPSVQYRNSTSAFSSFLSPHMSMQTEGGNRNESYRDDENSLSKKSVNAEYLAPGFPGSNQDAIKGDPSPYGIPSIARTIPNSKYLKAAQQLLNEVVNVRKALKQPDSDKTQNFDELRMKGSKEADGGLRNGNTSPSVSGVPSNPQESISNSPSELSAAERQDLQNKLTKLLSMLDEVDRKYKQYNHQMQIVVLSFDGIAGCGAAKPYTALALQTISRHFRCLRDAITSQVRATRKSLGEQDTSANSKGVRITRLRFVDQQLRQQRALQHLGMMQQHAWRPQRGLPESSVSILRAWLFEHFLHPYPKDSDKIMLARQTGLTRSQVSNWFINARVRLWKPMVEEMYKEEIRDVEMDSNSSSENAPNTMKGDTMVSEDGHDAQQSTTSTATERASTSKFLKPKSDHFPDAEMAGSTVGVSFQNGGETETEYGVVKLRGDQRSSMGDCSLYPDAIAQSGGASERLMAAATAYQMSEFGRFGTGGDVSLTLGLQHCEGAGLPIPSGDHQGLVMRGDEIYNASASSVGHETLDFESMDPGNRQHRFGSSHLLHDFVA